MSRDLVVALSGGIGGAKLALGLSRILAPDNLIVVANVGDDFEHLGLHVSPDSDTLMYALAGLDNTKLGWGRRDETWSFMETLAALGGEDWFRLGDRDLAVHVERTRRLEAGEPLSAITADFCRRLGVAPRVCRRPTTALRTRLRTDEGWLDFQDYFVRLQCRPQVRELAFDGAQDARPQPDLVAALSDERLRAVVVCPSNPFISVEPILAVRGMREALARCGAPVVAVSPIIGGRAVKGPTAKMMTELGIIPGAAAVAARYGDLIDGYVMDVEDAGEAAQVAAKVTLAPTLMTSLAEKEQLARVVLEAADALASSETRPGLRCVSGIWAIVPVKEFEGAKQRLSPALSADERRVLAATMLEDVLDALSAVRELAGLLVVTIDPAATSLATRYGARVVADGARDGHTGAVTAAARLLVREGHAAMMTMPGDIPRATSAEIAATVAAHRAAPAFTIVPAHDDLGSNTIVMSPPDAVPLRFGEDSFYPHLDAARARGIEPLVVRHPGIGMDIDNPVDLVAFLRMSPPAATRTLAFLEQSGVAARLLKQS